MQVPIYVIGYQLKTEVYSSNIFAGLVYVILLYYIY